MTVKEVENHRYWVDEHGNIWERRSYCLEPTATFVRMTSYGPEREQEIIIDGAIGCRNMQGLVPLKHERFEIKL